MTLRSSMYFCVASFTCFVYKIFNVAEIRSSALAIALRLKIKERISIKFHISPKKSVNSSYLFLANAKLFCDNNVSKCVIALIR